MAAQNYSNHIRFYPAHHFVFLPLSLALIIVSATFIFKFPQERHLWIATTVLLVMITWVCIMLRQHYALNNQNRIVRLEMRLRYYELTGKRLESVEQQLTFGQLSALRFASDDELLSLMEKALKEHLAPNDIKKQIKHWVPDEMRV